MKNRNETSWDVAYEWKAVALLGLGFGLVSIDRFLIMPLFPVMMKDLSLNYQDLGYITGILAITWGLSAMFMGRLSDRFGHRAIIIPAVILFSLLAGFSGLATGLFSLMLVRAVIGLAEGAYTPASIVATLYASKPTRHGLNIGIQQAAMPLLGLGLAPIVATQLLQVMEWHWVFALVMIPGLLVGYLLHRVLRNTDANAAADHTITQDASDHKWTDIFKSRNIPLNMIGMLCWLTSLVVLSAFLPNYLIDYLQLSMAQMGFVLSAIGFGGALGTIIMPGLSDKIGRKPVMIISTLGSMSSIYMLINTGAETTQLFTLLFITVFFNFSLICLTVGPLTTEAVPAKLMSTASGIVIGVGEVFGGGIAPGIAGYVAHNHGIEYTLLLAVGAMGFGLLIAISLKETAPVRINPSSSNTVGEVI
jgi:MFS family permease